MMQFAIYSRKSRFTGKGESIGNQVEMCRDYIRLRYSPEEAEAALIYEDEGFSGGNLNRPGFQRMMADAKEKKFGAVVIYRLDRISRSIGDFSNLITQLAEYQVEFLCIKEQFDTSSSMGRAMMYISSVFSQLERETIAERIRDNMQELAKTGRWLGGVTPTGYTSESVTSVSVDGKQRRACKLKLLPDEAELVRTIYDIYRETDSLTATETELLRRGVVTKTGKPFTRFSIKNILQNPVYVRADGAVYAYFKNLGAYLYAEEIEFDGRRGIMAYNRTTQTKGKTATIHPVGEWTVTVGEHEGVISAQIWLAVQSALERNKSKSYRKARTERNQALLTGMIYCTCGSRMYAKVTSRTTADGQPSYTYICKEKERSKKTCCSVGNVNGNRLDEEIMTQLRLLVEDDDQFVQQLNQYRSQFEGEKTCEVTAELEQRCTKLTTQIEILLDTLAQLGDSAARTPVIQRIEHLSEEQTGLRTRIASVEKQCEGWAWSEHEWAVYVQKLLEFSSACQAITLEQTRAIVRELVHKVIWDGETAHVVLFGAE